jgi:dihydroorotate dehydrogenase (fumarate)
MKLNSSWGLTVGGSITHSLTQIMRSHAFCPAMPLAASGGIASPPDAIKTLLAGADVAMVTSAIYREGASIIRILNDGLREFMERNHLISMRDLQLKRPLEFANDEDRAAYIAALTARLETAPTSHTRSIRHPGQLID